MLVQVEVERIEVGDFRSSGMYSQSELCMVVLSWKDREEGVFTLSLVELSNEGV